MSINEATGGLPHRAGALPVSMVPRHPPGWIASRNQQFKMKSDFLLEVCLSLRRRCAILGGHCLDRLVQP
ncbi:MAG: hypothetical protein HN485_21790 [Rhodospirillaceae bacterium]|nr:hypothetical protein [Rhodospirillaceae bacterium]MBT4117904.1 hypothetical protein [Rhodospirillaceae bacterium]